MDDDCAKENDVRKLLLFSDQEIRESLSDQDRTFIQELRQKVRDNYRLEVSFVQQSSETRDANGANDDLIERKIEVANKRSWLSVPVSSASRYGMFWKATVAGMSLVVVGVGIGRVNAVASLANATTVHARAAQLLDVPESVAVDRVDELGQLLQASCEGIDKWRWFLGNNERRAAEELVEDLMLLRAKAEFSNAHLANANYDEEGSVGLRLCGEVLARAISRGATNSRRAEILWTKAKGEFLFGVSRRGSGNLAADRMFYDSARSSIASIELLKLDAHEVNPRVLEASALLAKALHKGALRGEEQKVESGELVKPRMKDSIIEIFPALAGTPPDQFIRQLCLHLISSPAMNEESGPATQAYAEVANTLALHLINADDDPSIQDAINRLKIAIARVAKAEQLASNNHVQLLHARMLGNLADAYLKMGNVEAQRDHGLQAMEVMLTIPSQYRDKEFLGELGWIVSRLVIAEYRTQIRTEKSFLMLSRYLHELSRSERTSDGQIDFRGFQINKVEQELVLAIEAWINPRSRITVNAAEILSTSMDAVKNGDKLTVSRLRTLLSDFESLPGLNSDSDFKDAIKLLAGE